MNTIKLFDYWLSLCWKITNIENLFKPNSGKGKKIFYEKMT